MHFLKFSLYFGFCICIEFITNPLALGGFIQKIDVISFCVSLTEIENARGIMDVLTEMLNAIGPENKEVS